MPLMCSIYGECFAFSAGRNNDDAVMKEACCNFQLIRFWVAGTAGLAGNGKPLGCTILLYISVLYYLVPRLHLEWPLLQLCCTRGMKWRSYSC